MLNSSNALIDPISAMLSNDNSDSLLIIPTFLTEKIDQAKEIIKKSIKSVKQLNWAWQFWNEQLGIWEQFQCPECLNLEFYYQAYTISGLK